MFSSKQFRDLIIQPVLKAMSAWAQEDEDILVMTMSHESNGGEYLKQLGNGPAFGCYQMERGTFNDLWVRTLKNEKDSLHEMIPKIMDICNLKNPPQPEEMAGNLYLATAMARVYYLRIRTPIPKDYVQMSEYCKKYWNTEYGKATPSDYLRAYYKFENIGRPSA